MLNFEGWSLFRQDSRNTCDILFIDSTGGKRNGPYDCKKTEISEYSIRENIFYGTLAATELADLWTEYPSAVLMAAVIELAEQFETEKPDGAADEMKAFAKANLPEKLKTK